MDPQVKTKESEREWTASPLGGPQDPVLVAGVRLKSTSSNCPKSWTVTQVMSDRSRQRGILIALNLLIALRDTYTTRVYFVIFLHKSETFSCAVVTSSKKDWMKYDVIKSLFLSHTHEVRRGVRESRFDYSCGFCVFVFFSGWAVNRYLSLSPSFLFSSFWEPSSVCLSPAWSAAVIRTCQQLLQNSSS